MRLWLLNFVYTNLASYHSITVDTRCIAADGKIFMNIGLYVTVCLTTVSVSDPST